MPTIHGRRTTTVSMAEAATSQATFYEFFKHFSLYSYK